MYNPQEGSHEISPQAEATKALIRDMAEGLFGHYGYSKTSIGDIAKACTMSPGNLYRYYRNKQAIGLAVVERYFERQAAKMTAAKAVEGPAEARLRGTITAGVTHLVEMMDGNPRLFEMAEFLCEDPDGQALLARHRDWKSDFLSNLVLEGVLAGEFDVPNAAEAGWDLLLTTTAFWMPQALMAWHDQEMILEDLQRVLDLILPGMRADG